MILEATRNTEKLQANHLFCFFHDFLVYSYFHRQERKSSKFLRLESDQRNAIKSVGNELLSEITVGHKVSLAMLNKSPMGMH